MSRASAILACALLSSAAGCRPSDSTPANDAPQPETQSAPQEAAATAREELSPSPVRNARPPRPALARASVDIFGLPVPRGVTLEDRLPGIRHVRARASFDELIGFYDLHLPGGITVTEFERGARIVPRDAEGRAIYIYREPSSTLYTVSYLDPSESTPAVTAGEVDAPTSAELAPAEQREPAQPVGSAANANNSASPQADTTAATRTVTRQAEFLDRELGRPIENDGSARNPPTPITSSVIRPASERPEEFRSYRPPLRFVRGVREDRRNPNALF